MWGRSVGTGEGGLADTGMSGGTGLGTTDGGDERCLRFITPSRLEEQMQYRCAHANKSILRFTY
ncbi:hypothetical protein E2C01_049856 [Portunus trituberculatus]|uniref:Uncharacterized protein n=1 Tax=Portunus trituberculatus TaxID=210409 RepID=A0A5B7G7H3_PORTR|nr:hypothetical protein [Portunus trituberculatus]